MHFFFSPLFFENRVNLSQGYYRNPPVKLTQFFELLRMKEKNIVFNFII